MNQTISATTARRQFGRILTRASEGEARFFVTRRGGSSVIIMGINDYVESIVAPPDAYEESRQEAKRKNTNRLSMLAIDRRTRKGSEEPELLIRLL